MNNILIVISFCLFSFFTTLAQDKKKNTPDKDSLTPEQEFEMIFQKAAFQKISDFQDNLAMMAGKDLSAEEKLTYKDVAADLFINKGKTVVMESAYKSPLTGEMSMKKEPLLVYFDKLCNLKNARVAFGAAKDCHITDLYEMSDSNGKPVYKALATFYQEFINYKSDGSTFHEISQIRIRVEMRMKTDLEGLHGRPYIVLLGDVSLAETK